MKNKNKEQINISLPIGWKKELERLARKISFEEDKNLSYLDLIRVAIAERYDLNDEEA